jgi:site-specific recombinase XerD
VRKIIKEYGSRGSRRCLVIHEKRGRYLVERYVAGKAKRKRFADETHAKAWAKRWYDAGLPQTHDFSLRALIDKWMETEAEKKKWRPATWANYRNHRKRIEQVLGPDTKANTLGHAELDDLWVKLSRLPMAPNQIAQKVKMLRRVFGWAVAREYVSHNKLATWAIPEVRKLSPSEYTPAETEKILGQWNYRDGWQWRPWALTMIEQSHGIRINALLNLRWDTDADLLNAVLGMRAETDKTKESWSRPITWDALSALLTARWHNQRLGKASPWVFYGKNGRPYTYGAYHAAL